MRRAPPNAPGTCKSSRLDVRAGLLLVVARLGLVVGLVVDRHGIDARAPVVLLRLLALPLFLERELARPLVVRLSSACRHPSAPFDRSSSRRGALRRRGGKLRNYASATFVACGPFSPCPGSYCTFAFSSRLL